MPALFVTVHNMDGVAVFKTNQNHIEGGAIAEEEVIEGGIKTA
jgi:hypothetical protein